ncbi:hemolysin family protein [Acetobacteraceae bacterium ESL0709]|nr:hemolysin family protein [Acetobacteraceae bacterium ESL0697]MDF7678399.1 hemolysin family protein [Acetobacteraceae bacterium ESL0709]
MSFLSANLHPYWLFAVGTFCTLVLIGISILISLSEISFAAARESRMRGLAEEGDKRAKAFLALRRNSGKVMTAIQICLNAMGILGGIVGDSMLGHPLGHMLREWGMAPVLAQEFGSLIAFFLVTGLFVLFADLLPKRVAMNAPNQVALKVSWFPALTLKLLYPAVWIFSHISDALLRVLHIPAAPMVERMTPEDLRAVLAAGTASGVLLEQEHQMIQNVMALQDRSVTSAMTPRDEIVYLEVSESLESQRDKVRVRPYSRYPLCDGGLDHVIGSIRAEDVLVAMVDEPAASKTDKTTQTSQIFQMRRDVLSLPDTLNLWETLAQFDTHGAGFALIINEYGLVVGLTTYKDIMGALMDGLANPFEEQAIVPRDKDSWLIDGAAPIGDVVRELDIPLFEDGHNVDTIGGFVMHRLRRMARKADRVKASGFCFEVVDVEGFRINQLLVTRISALDSREKEQRKS